MYINGIAHYRNTSLITIFTKIVYIIWFEGMTDRGVTNCNFKEKQ